MLGLYGPPLCFGSSSAAKVAPWAPVLRVCRHRPVRRTNLNSCERARSVPAAAEPAASMGVPTQVEAARIRPLNQHPIPAPSAVPPVEKARNSLQQPFVLYWMLNSIREKQSPALEYAAAVAKHLRVPLRAAHTFDVIAQDGSPLTERHAYFLLEGLADVQKTLREKRNVTLAVVAPGSPPEVSVLALGEHAVAIITDTSYLRKGIQDRLRVASALKKAKRNIPFVAVEGDIVVPVEQVTDHVEHAARTIRPKITRLVPKYLKALDPVELPSDIQPALDPANLAKDGTRAWLCSAGLGTLDVRDVAAAVKSLNGIDRGVPRVPSGTFEGGETTAHIVFARFLKERLARYAEGRNEPALMLQSDISPYLRTGSISVVDIVMQAQDRAERDNKKGVKEGVASFLEELIVRRELSVNMCWFARDDYDVYERTVPEYAKASLELHKADKRPVVYSYEELEAALTYDQYWNTAQLELVATGKVIGWTPDAQTALDYCLRLNNRWELDAVDPNSYAGIIWNFGRHDQGWKERPIWGKVRYMNEAGLKRKFNMAAYISKVESFVRKNGLPDGITRLRQASKSHGRKFAQTTLDNMDSKRGGKRQKTQ